MVNKSQMRKVIGFSFLFIAIILFIYFQIRLTEDLSRDPEIKEVPCYDRAWNEIKDMMCEEIDYGTAKYVPMALLTGFLFAIAILLLVFPGDKI